MSNPSKIYGYPSESEAVAPFGTVQTDHEKAENLRAMLSENLKAICETMDFARREGLIVGFSVSLNVNTGKYEYGVPTVARHY